MWRSIGHAAKSEKKKKTKRLSSMGSYLNYGKVSRVKTVNDDDL